MHSERNQKTPQRMVDDASSRVCFAYFNALGQLQNLAPDVELAAEQPGPPSIMQCVEVIVPQGLKPGDEMSTTVNGVPIVTTVPAGAVPGKPIQLQVDAVRCLAQEVVRAHRETNDLIGVLEREHGTETLQRERLNELREQDEQITERLRRAVTDAEAARTRVQEGLRTVERDHLS